MIRIYRSPLLLSALSLLLLSQTACVAPVLIGAGAATGVAAAQEGGIQTTLTDAEIQARINDLWFRQDTSMFSKLDLTVDQGRVLITGVVQKQQARVDAVRLAWQVKGVKQVINEIKIANSEGIQGYVRDVWITTQMRSKMTFDSQIQSINYNFDTVQATIYLMGQAHGQKELDRVIQVARSIKGVQNVVSYVKLIGTPTIADNNSGDVYGTSPTSLTGNSGLNTDMGDMSGPAVPVAPVAPAESIQRETIQ